MFSVAIRDVNLGSDEARSLYPMVDVQKDVWPDQSLAIAARMLYENRATSDNPVHFRYESFTSPNKDNLNALFASTPANAVIFAIMNADFIAGFTPEGEGWDEQTDIQEYLKNELEFIGKLFINHEAQKTIVMAQYLSQPLFHFLCALMPRYTPWIFEKFPLTDDDIKLVFSLKESEPDAFKAIVEHYSLSSEFNRKYAKMRLANVEQNIYLRAYSNQEQQYTSLNDRLDEYHNREAETLRQMRDVSYMMRGIKQAMNEAKKGESELANLFATDKRLRFVESSDSSFTFDVISKLEFFDPEMYTDIVDNEDSYFFECLDSNISDKYDHDDIRSFYDAIFDSGAIKLHMAARYKLDVDTLEVSTVSSARYRNDNCLPNPHIRHFNCLGDHHRYITENLRNANMAGAVMQCIVSAESLNVGEAPTMEHFIGDISSNSDKCFELPDGTMCNMSEAIDWLVS